MKSNVRDATLLIASVGVGVYIYRWFGRFLADFAGTRAGVDIATGRVSLWATDDRPRAIRDPKAGRSAE